MFGFEKGICWSLNWMIECFVGYLIRLIEWIWLCIVNVMKSKVFWGLFIEVFVLSVFIWKLIVSKFWEIFLVVLFRNSGSLI